MGVTIFLGPILGLKKMVGPRRPLRRFLTPGTLKRSENPTLPDGEFTTAASMSAPPVKACHPVRDRAHDHHIGRHAPNPLK